MANSDDIQAILNLILSGIESFEREPQTMANPESLAVLRQGVKVWNVWRLKHDLWGSFGLWGDHVVNLREANLRNADLREANLRNADLRDADLRDADLKDADLRDADLKDADLSWANLSGANLYGADLSRANLQLANLHLAALSGARLGWVALSSACLSGADLSAAVLEQTIFSNTDLTAVEGLETCRHLGPSTLDHRTLVKSGPLPLVFLRGCGLPDALIDNLSAILNEYIQYYSCFISYTSRDQDFAKRLYDDLQNKGVRCWFAPEDMETGDEFRSRIDTSIQLYDRLLLVLSAHSLKSPWVQKEVETAFEKEKKANRLVLFPIRLDDVVMQINIGWAADIRRQRHIGDFTQWKEHDAYQQAFDRLLRDLKAESGQPHG